MMSRYYETKSRTPPRLPKPSAKGKARLRKQSGVYGKHRAPKTISQPDNLVDDDEEVTRINVVARRETPSVIPPATTTATLPVPAPRALTPTVPPPLARTPSVPPPLPTQASTVQIPRPARTPSVLPPLPTQASTVPILRPARTPSVPPPLPTLALTAPVPPPALIPMDLHALTSTAVPVPSAVATVRLPETADDLFRVGMVLNREELAELWVQKNALTTEKVLVWSEYKNAWVSLMSIPEICNAIAQARLDKSDSWAPEPVTIPQQGPARTREQGAQRTSAPKTLAHRFEALLAHGRVIMGPMGANIALSVTTALTLLAIVAIFLPARWRSDTSGAYSELSTDVRPNRESGPRLLTNTQGPERSLTQKFPRHVVETDRARDSNRATRRGVVGRSVAPS